MKTRARFLLSTLVFLTCALFTAPTHAQVLNGVMSGSAIDASSAAKPKPTPKPSPTPRPTPPADPNGAWTANASGDWSDPTKWSGNTVASGAGSTADFSTIDITSGRTVTVDGNFTIGTLLVGDTTSGFSAYTFASSGGSTLTFNNNGAGAVLTQAANTGSNIFNSTLALVLADNLTINNNAANGTARSLTTSGGITGTGNLTINSNGNTANPITFDTTSLNMTGSITNSGTGGGTVTISSVIGSNVTGVNQNSSTSILSLSGVNTYSGATTINAGTLQLTGSGSANNTSFTVNSGGTLELNNPVANNTANHVGTSGSNTITMNGGTLSFSHVTTSTATDFSTTAGPISLQSGASSITASTASATNSHTSTFALTSLSRSVGATVNFNGTNLGTAQNQIGFTTTPTLVNSVLPYATFGNTGTNATFAGLSGTNIASATSSLTTFVATGGVSTTDYNQSGTISGVGTETIGSLRVQANVNGQSLSQTSGTTLTLAGDGLAFATGNSNYTISGGNITVGNGVGAYELIIHQMASGTGTLTIGSTIIDNGANAVSLTKSGPGTLILNGANTYSGTTYINQGTLTLDNNSTTTSRLANTSSIIINSTGTLLLAGTSTSTDRINNSAGVTINGGGTFNTGALSEGTRPSSSGATDGVAGLGALTLQNTSVTTHATINFTTGNSSSLVFSSLSGAAGAFVDVLNWNGLARTDDGSTTNDRLLFATDPGLSQDQLANWQFFDNTGAAFATGAMEIKYGNMFEIVPIPEPSTWFAAGLAFGAVGYMQRRRLRRLFA